jgi:hypothetical protein
MDQFLHSELAWHWGVCMCVDESSYFIKSKIAVNHFSLPAVQ